MTNDVQATDVQRVQVHAERCIGAGNCVDAAPKHFDQDPSDGTVIVLSAEVLPEDEADVLDAIDICPVGALFLA